MLIATVFAFLTVFSIVAVGLSEDDTRKVRDPRDNPLLWAYGRR